MNPADPRCLVRVVTNEEVTSALAANGQYYRYVFGVLRSIKAIVDQYLAAGFPESDVFGTTLWHELDGPTQATVLTLWQKYRDVPIPAEDDKCWKQFDVTPDKIVELTGIDQRFWVKPGVATSNLAAQAAEQALQVSGLNRQRVDFVIVATTTPDHPQTPGTANRTAWKLGIRTSSVWCFDVSSACTSFVSALGVGYSLIRSGMFRRGLVIGADVMGEPTTSRFNRNVRIILADAARCVVLEACPLAEDAFHPGQFSYGSDNSLGDLIVTPAGGSALEITPIMLVDPFDQRHRMQMDGPEVRKRAQRLLLTIRRGENDEQVVTGAIADAVRRAGVDYAGIDVALFHQANKRIIDPVVDSMVRLGFRGLVHDNIQWYGNTTSASIGLCLDEAW
ncbi:MAG: 3-oxoacyl-[acyl-carrier-protein] synthase III C-terminal domain-containing protein, partial [Patescibacteria group bacterium]